MITSTSNEKVKLVRKLQAQSQARREAGAFVVEGVRLTEEALAAGWRVNLALYTDELPDRGKEVLPHLQQAGAQVEKVSEHVLKAAADTQNPQGLVVVVEQKLLPVPEKVRLALILDTVRDPGNLGTMLRSAAAAGVNMVWLSPGCADPYSPKVVRAGMGAHFRVPLRQAGWGEIGEAIKKHGLEVYLAAAGGALSYDRADLRKATAFVIGGEAEGAGAEARQLTTKTVSIPMAGGVESLNAAAAAAVLLFEAVRQRRS